MSWEKVLAEDDYRLFRGDISLLEERVIQNFPDVYRNPGILAAIRSVPRHLFVNAGYKFLAYTDNALPTLGGLTTSAPSVIGRMIAEVGVSSGDKVLEIGTGTGYEASILAEMGARIWTIEIDGFLAQTANRLLVQLGYKSGKGSSQARRSRPIRLYWGDGRQGLAEQAPFDGIIVAASIPDLRQVRQLAAQLSAAGGRMVVPVGDRLEQELRIVERRGARLAFRTLPGVSFQFLRLSGRDA
jgi:protein-L-isoaspartate(D-aspartate) O-methyltransferase